MANQRTLRIHLIIEVTRPQHSSLFQSLVPAFCRFQGLAETTLFSAVLHAIQDRAKAELQAAFPGRFRYKGTRLRKRRLPFGEVAFPLCKLWDRKGRRTVWPLAEVTALPRRIRGCGETLLPGYRLAVIRSFHQSRKAVRGMTPNGSAPSHSTLHRRFRGFAARLDPVPDLRHRRGPKPTAYQMTDGTKRLRRRFPTLPKVLVSDGEEWIPQALAGPRTIHQRCLVHARRNLAFALYQDGRKKADRKGIESAFRRIRGLHLCRAEMARLDPQDKAALRELLAASERAFAEIERRLPANAFP